MSSVKFDGEVGSTELQRITAKKNYASSMQAHKMGATFAFDALRKALLEKYPDLANEANAPTAVKQLPIYTFIETPDEGNTGKYNRTSIGNFTVGADKGDKGYFGFKQSGIKNVAIRLEGTDHLKGVGFNYPWAVNGVDNIKYSAEKEALCIITGADSTKWTAILEQSASGDKDSEADIENYLKQEFQPAYDCAYRANPLLAGTTATLAEMNANIEAFSALRRSEDNRPYSYCEIWRDGEYDLYYLNQERNQYEKNGVNLYDELSAEEKALVDAATSIEEKNKVFINFRINRFAQEVANYWSIDDAIFQLVFLYIFVASDNFEKNMYPYKMRILNEGGRWRFLQDDLDSIFSTDNQAQDTKKYSAELEDFTDDKQNAYVFKGEDNAFFQALKRAFPDRVKKMGRDMLQAMYDLSPYGTKTLDKLMGFFDYFFFDRAQNYFTKSAYNNDAEYSYEQAWRNKEYVAKVDIHPLAQSLGDHNLAERQFAEKRMIYLMSKFGFGGYGSYEDSSLGIISFRTQVAQGFTLTPAIDSYPTILGGQAQVSSAAERVIAGNKITLPPVGGGNTNTYIVGTDWLSDIGDLKDMVIDPSSEVGLSVSSKRLQRLKVGDENASLVTSQLKDLKVNDCPSLTSVDARNLSSLAGVVDLSRCPRLREAFFAGTKVAKVAIADGSKIEVLELPASITSLKLVGLKNLKWINKSLPLSWVNGVALLSGNNTSSNSAYRYCDYVNVSKYTSIEVDGYFGSDNGLHFYDSNKAVISFISANTLGLANNTQSYNNVIRVPENAVYCRLCGRIDTDLNIRVTDMSLIIESLSNVSDLRIENCEGIDSFELMRSAYEEDNSMLAKIRVVGFDKVGQQADIVMLSNMIDDKDKNGIQHAYWGINVDGTDAPHPIIEGSLHISDPVNGDDYNKIVGTFTSLILDATNIVRYIKFDDQVVAQICADNWGDKTGITKEQAAAVTSLGTAFKGNTEIEYFDEIRYFTGLTSIANDAFNGCTALADFHFPENISTIGDMAFKGSGLLNCNLLLPKVTTINSGAFNSTKLRSVVMPEIISVGGAYNDSYTTFGFCPNIEYLFFGSKVNNISPYILKSSNKSVIMIVAATTPPTFGGDSFDYGGAPATIYVPKYSLEAYKTTTNWSRYAAKLFSIEDDMQTKHAEIYEEIKDYL